MARRRLPRDFWANVDKSGDCWLWLGTRRRDGYGVFTPEGGRQVRAHRVAFLESGRTIPLGRLVCHRCDNPPCVRPDHLWLGSDAENVADMRAKGREGVSPFRGQVQKGEANRYAKLTEKDVRMIRCLGAGGVEQKAIAAFFGVHRATVHYVLRGKTWSHVG